MPAAVRLSSRYQPALDAVVNHPELIPKRGDSDLSWTVSRSKIEPGNYGLKAVNPNATIHADTRRPEELLDDNEARGREVAAGLAELRSLLTNGSDRQPIA